VSRFTIARLGCKLFAHFHKRANDRHAHLKRSGTVQHVRCLKCTVFRKGPRTVSSVLATSFLKVANCDLKYPAGEDEVAICDLKIVASSVVSWKAKSSGNRF
jgi:hypothetical protein